jgi:hypothetical protein
MPVEDERLRTADEVCDMIHSAANVVRTALTSTDKKAEEALRKAAKTLLTTAIKRLDESVGTAIADEEDE